MEGRGAFYLFNKACDFFSTGLLRFSWIFLDNKRSYQKGVRDYLEVREGGMNAVKLDLGTILANISFI